MYLPYRPADVDNVFNTSLRAFRDISEGGLDHEDGSYRLVAVFRFDRNTTVIRKTLRPSDEHSSVDVGLSTYHFSW
jgi:hypothetical protein